MAMRRQAATYGDTTAERQGGVNRMTPDIKGIGDEQAKANEPRGERAEREAQGKRETARPPSQIGLSPAPPTPRGRGIKSSRQARGSVREVVGRNEKEYV